MPRTAAATAAETTEPRPPTALERAVTAIREHDEAAQVMWKARGAKGTACSEIAGVLAKIDGHRVLVVVQVFERGGFQLYREFDLPSGADTSAFTKAAKDGEQKAPPETGD